jgi:hypothetical protein
MANPNNKSAPTPQVIKKAKTNKRSYSGTVSVTTDLFKLLMAKVIKHDSGATEGAHPEEHANEFTAYEHTHPYRTLDKLGRLQDKCVPIAGHFHLVEVELSNDPDTPPTVKSVSPPMVMGTRKVNGRPVQIPVPANEYDFHTHDIEYVRSGDFQASKLNVEAAAVVSKVANLTDVTLAGVTQSDSSRA